MWKSKIRKELNLNKLQPFTDSTRRLKYNSIPTPPQKYGLLQQQKSGIRVSTQFY